MLVLTRRNGQQVVLKLPCGRLARVTVMGRRPVRLAVEAPPEVQILRGELAAEGQLRDGGGEQRGPPRGR
jgi:sRNA-binding carbon storage regulator CsrA